MIHLDLSVLRRKEKSRQVRETLGKFMIGTPICRLFPKEALKTFTSDREKEFECYPLVDDLGIALYYQGQERNYETQGSQQASAYTSRVAHF